MLALLILDSHADSLDILKAAYCKFLGLVWRQGILEIPQRPLEAVCSWPCHDGGGELRGDKTVRLFRLGREEKKSLSSLAPGMVRC